MVRVNWQFACGHTRSLEKLAAENCPSCQDTESSEAHSEEGQKKDKHALSVWKAQVDNIKKLITDAEINGDEELKRQLDKMLKNCNVLWAKKFIELEKKGLLKEDEERDMDKKFKYLEMQVDIQKVVEKVETLISVRGTLRDIGSHDDRTLYEKQWKDMTEMGERVNALKTEYESLLMKDMKTFENRLGDERTKLRQLLE